MVINLVISSFHTKKYRMLHICNISNYEKGSWEAVIPIYNTNAVVWIVIGGLKKKK